MAVATFGNERWLPHRYVGAEDIVLKPLWENLLNRDGKGTLIPMLAGLGESHLTYPVLHYFHSTKRSASAAAGVASLDEALTILECGLQKGCSLDLPSLG